MSVVAVMEGIEARLETISGLRVSATVQSQINPPAALVGVPPITDYLEAYGRGKYSLAPTITVLTSSSWDRTGQLKLAQFADLAGPLSIPAAIHADPKLGGAVEACEVTSFRPLNREEVGAIQYYGGLFVLRCMVRETAT